MIPLRHEAHFTFRFGDDRTVSRVHLTGVERGRRASVLRRDPVTGECRDLVTAATVGEDGWLDLPEPVVVRAGDVFVVIPDAARLE